MASKEKMGVAQLQTDAAKKKKELSDAERSQRLAERELKRVEQNLEDAKRDEAKKQRRAGKKAAMDMAKSGAAPEAVSVESDHTDHRDEIAMALHEATPSNTSANPTRAEALTRVTSGQSVPSTPIMSTLLGGVVSAIGKGLGLSQTPVHDSDEQADEYHPSANTEDAAEDGEIMAKMAELTAQLKALEARLHVKKTTTQDTPKFQQPSNTVTPYAPVSTGRQRDKLPSSSSSSSSSSFESTSDSISSRDSSTSDDSDSSDGGFSAEMSKKAAGKVSAKKAAKKSSAKEARKAAQKFAKKEAPGAPSSEGGISPSKFPENVPDQISVDLFSGKHDQSISMKIVQQLGAFHGHKHEGLQSWFRAFSKSCHDARISKIGAFTNCAVGLPMREALDKTYPDWGSWSWATIHSKFMEVFDMPVDHASFAAEFHKAYQANSVPVVEHADLMRQIALKGQLELDNPAVLRTLARSFTVSIQQELAVTGLSTSLSSWDTIVKTAKLAEQRLTQRHALELERSRSSTPAIQFAAALQSGAAASEDAIIAAFSKYNPSHRGRSDMRCHNCGKRGHIAKDCRQESRQVTKTATTGSSSTTKGAKPAFKKGVSLNEHTENYSSICAITRDSIRTSVKVNGKHSLVAVIDTGAEVSVIRGDVLQGIALKPSSIRLVDAFNRDYTGVKGTAAIDLTIGSITRRVDVVVVEDLAAGMLIGEDLQAAFGLNIDVAKGCAKLGNSPLKILAVADLHQNASPLLNSTQKESCPTQSQQCPPLSHDCPGQKHPLSGRVEAVAKLVLHPSFRREESPTNVSRAEDLIRECIEAFALDDDPHRVASVPPVRLYVYPGRPVQLKTKKLSMKERAAAEKIINDGLRDGIFELATGEWSASGKLVLKKNGTYRLVTNFIPLNKRIDKIPVSVPGVREVLQAIGSFKYISTADLTSMFWQFPLDPASRAYTGFSLAGYHLQYKCLPMGLINSSGHTQRFLQDLLRGVGRLSVYSDDLTLPSDSFDEHLEQLGKMLRALKSAGLRLKASKSCFFAPEATVLGHSVTPTGYAPTGDRMEAIRNLPTPKCAADLRSVMQMLTYDGSYHVKKFSIRADPLYKLLKEGCEWAWTSEHDRLFQDLKNEFAIGTCTLAYPLSGGGKYRVTSDASDVGAGAYLEQLQHNRWRIIEHYSKRWSDTETRYSATDRELLAAVTAVTRWRRFLQDDKFIIRVDHKPLSGLKLDRGGRQSDARRARWVDEVQDLQFEFVYLPGKDNILADLLSRYAYGGTKSSTGPAMVSTGVQCVLDLPSGDTIPGEKSRHSGISNANASPRTVGAMSFVHPDSEPISLEQVKIAQENDDLCKEVKAALQEIKPGAKRAHLAALTRNWPGQPFLKDGAIHVVTGRGHASTTRVYVPHGIRDEVIKSCHSTRLGGHPGVVKTFAAAAGNYFWPGLHDDVVDYVARCRTCTLTKRSHGGPNLQTGTLHATAVGELISMDLAGPLPTDRDGHSYFLVMVDNFSLYAVIVGLHEATAAATASAFLRFWVAERGMPKKILSDNGPNFTASALADLISRMGGKQVHSAPYYPQGDGLVERAIQTLKTLVTSLVRDGNFETWGDALPFAQLAFNTSVAKSTGLAPYWVMTGRDQSAVAIATGGGPTVALSMGEAAADASRNVEIIDREIAKLWAEKDEKRAEDNDLVPDHGFNPGDLVYKQVPTKLHKFLEDRWTGPYKVVKILFKHTSIIIPEEGGPEEMVSLRRLKHAARPKSAMSTQQSSTASDITTTGGTVGAGSDGNMGDTVAPEGLEEPRAAVPPASTHRRSARLASKKSNMRWGWKANEDANE